VQKVINSFSDLITSRKSVETSFFRIDDAVDLLQLKILAMVLHETDVKDPLNILLSFFLILLDNASFVVIL
jgi:hypothetical protein